VDNSGREEPGARAGLEKLTFPGKSHQLLLLLPLLAHMKNARQAQGEESMIGEGERPGWRGRRINRTENGKDLNQFA
jgi:hypothetical protein